LATTRKRRFSADAQKRRLGIVLILPSLLSLAIFIFKPLLDSIFMSQRKIDLLFGGPEEFVGFQNFIWLFQTEWFLPTLGRTLLITAAVMATQLVLAFLLGLLTDFDFRGKGLVRSFMMAPWATPIFVAALIWSWMYEPNISPFNRMLVDLGILENPVTWLGNPSTALPAVMIALVWKGLPFVYLVLLAGLQQISEELKDAARIDGAGYVQVVRYVILPGLRHVITTVVILRTIFLFNHFSFIFLLTGGGPLQATETMAIAAVKVGVDSFRYGRASAITTTMFLILLAMFFLYFSIDKKRITGGES
jgi:multiple sugar transport system permease protein